MAKPKAKSQHVDYSCWPSATKSPSPKGDIDPSRSQECASP